MFWSGNIAFASSVTCYLTGETAAAHELLQFALVAWLSALQLPPQGQHDNTLMPRALSQARGISTPRSCRRRGRAGRRAGRAGPVRR